MKKNLCEFKVCNENNIDKSAKFSSQSDARSIINELTHTHTHILDIKGLDCLSCAKELEIELKASNCVKDAQIDFFNNKVKIKCTNTSGCIDEIRKVAKNHGCEVIEVSPNEMPIPSQNFSLRNYIFTFEFGVILSSAFFIVLYTYYKMPLYAVLSILISSITIAKKAWLEIKRLKLGMNILMISAAYGSILIKEYLEGTMILFLFSISKWLENVISEKAKASIEVLKKNLPAIARKISDDSSSEELVPVSTLKPNDKILIKPFEVIPIDGIVDDGISQVDESNITGESMPNEKQKGDRIYAGTTNQDGSLKVIVTHYPHETKFSRILESIQIAQAQKTKLQTTIEIFAEKYTPIVFIVAIMSAFIPILLGSRDYITYIHRSLAILVISCPCALVLAVPVALVCAINKAAKIGILVKSGEVIENSSNIKAIAFDKTGTITKGEPTIVKIDILTQNMHLDDIIKIITALELHSEHRLASAFEKLLLEKNISKCDLPRVENFKAIKGYGIEGRINGINFRFGKIKWAVDILSIINHENTDLKLASVNSITQNLDNETRHSISLLCSEKELLAAVYFDDTLRDDAISTIQELYQIGIKHTVLLSGDRIESVKAFASASNINEGVGNLDPEEKKKYISQIISKYGPTIMVGDGINDTPALATANVGIAMGCRGVDAALATADAVIIHDKLAPLPQLISISKFTRKIIQQNIYFAISIKLAIFLLSILGYTSLWMAVLADTGASLMVVCNSLRVLRC